MDCFLFEHPTTKYILKNWKQGTHLVFHTKRFGVNNRWFEDFDSILGWEWYRILWGIIKVKPILLSLKFVLIRAFSLGLLAPEERVHLIPLVKVLKKIGYIDKTLNMDSFDLHIRMTYEHLGVENEQTRS